MRAHGTLTRAKADGCPCDQCGATVRAYENQRSRLIAYGQWEPYVDAEPVRAHIRRLGELGISAAQVAALAGVHRSVINGLLYGRGLGTTPSKRVRPATAAAILAVEATADDLPARALVDGTGTRRRLQALTACGWPLGVLAARLELTRSHMAELTSGTGQVRAGTARAVRGLYAKLWDQPPPEGDRWQRAAAKRTRTLARKHGWAPPMAWDDELIDLPDADLAAEIARRVAAMDDDDLRACHRGRKQGDPSPLIAAGGLEYERRRREWSSARERAA